MAPPDADCQRSGDTMNSRTGVEITDMLELEKIGQRIAALRKERGYTGERLAERLHVSPQAVSKWENAKSLPETAILPALAEALDCSIDSLLCPGELLVLEAVYTDGQTHIPITRFINDRVRGNALSICVNALFMDASLKSDRPKILTVKFQTPKGIGFAYALQNETLVLDKKSVCFTNDEPMRVIGAFYGNEKEYSCVMQKMEHYEYFKWDKIEVNHESFPSNTASDDTEYLTLVYLNAEGIHVISCPEGDAVVYAKNRTRLVLSDHEKCILKNVMPLSWEEGMDCPWAGALYAALQAMGEDCPYHRIMGMSGVCYQVCFTDVWDYSCTDALVTFDHATPLFKCLGRSFSLVERVEKQERKAERRAIMADLQRGKPVLAINLRVAPEWGVITGYIDGGERFLCRTYFDREIFDALEQEDSRNRDDRKVVFEEHEGYLFADNWPFLILHFGEKGNAPSAAFILRTSLTVFVESFHAPKCRGYYQGKEAYDAWMEGLSRDEDFELTNDRTNALRRLGVNDSMLCTLIDARRAAALWLQDNVGLLSGEEQGHLGRMAANCQSIADMLSAFRGRLRRAAACALTYNGKKENGASAAALRREQIGLLENARRLDEESCRLAELVLKSQGGQSR